MVGIRGVAQVEIRGRETLLPLLVNSAASDVAPRSASRPPLVEQRACVAGTGAVTDLSLVILLAIIVLSRLLCFVEVAPGVDEVGEFGAERVPGSQGAVDVGGE